MSIEIPLSQALTVEQAIAAATAAKIAAQQALADIPAVIDAEVGPASAPYIAQAESARDAAVVAKTVAETARDNALATERRMRQQSLGQFANDAAAEAWAAAQSPAITIITGSSYLNTTADIFRYAVVSAGPTIVWHDVTEDEAAQAVLAQASATAAAASAATANSVQNALNNRILGSFSTDPSWAGAPAGSPPWVNGARYYNTLSGKERVWRSVSGTYGWHDVDEDSQTAATAAAASATTATGARDTTTAARDVTLAARDVATGARDTALTYSTAAAASYSSAAALQSGVAASALIAQQAAASAQVATNLSILTAAQRAIKITANIATGAAVACDTTKDEVPDWPKKCVTQSYLSDTLNTATRGTVAAVPAQMVVMGETTVLSVFMGTDGLGALWKSWTVAGLTCVFARSGSIWYGGTGGLYRFDLITDEVYKRDTSGLWLCINQKVADYNQGTATWSLVSSAGAIASATVNSVSAYTADMTQSVKARFGLPNPTVAVGTNAGLSVIRWDGFVSNSASTQAYLSVAFDSYGNLWSLYNGGALYACSPATYQAASFNITALASFSLAQLLISSPSKITACGPGMVAIAGPSGLGMLKLDPTNPANSLYRVKTTTYDTGWMVLGKTVLALAESSAALTTLAAAQVVTNSTFATDLSGWTNGDVGTGYASAWNTGGGMILPRDGTAANYARRSQQITIPANAGGSISVTCTGGEVLCFVGTTPNAADIMSVQTASGTAKKSFNLPASGIAYITMLAATNGTSPVVTSIACDVAAADRSGSGNGAKAVGSPTRAQVASGADCAGYGPFGNTTYFEAAYASAMDFGTGDFCAMGWVTPASFEGWQAIFCYGNGLGSGSGWTLYQKAGTGELHMEVSVAGSATAFQSTRTLTAGAPAHIAVVRRSGVCELYINGVKAGSGALAQNVTQSGATLRIGHAGNESIATPSTFPYLGSSALQRVFSCAPPPDQIAFMYADEKGRFVANAKELLSGSTVQAVAFDPDTGQLAASNSTGGTDVFAGPGFSVRVANQKSTTGANYMASAAVSGGKLTWTAGSLGSQVAAFSGWGGVGWQFIDTASNVQHYWSYPSFTAASQQWTHVIPVKAASQGWVVVGFLGYWAYVNLATGAIGNTSGGATATTLGLSGAGEWLIAVASPALTSVTPFINPVSGNGVPTYAGAASAAVIFGKPMVLAGAFTASQVAAYVDGLTLNDNHKAAAFMGGDLVVATGAGVDAFLAVKPGLRETASGVGAPRRAFYDPTWGQYFGVTTDATPIVFASIPIPEGKAYRFRASVVAVMYGGTATEKAVYDITGVVSRDIGGNVVVVSTTTTVSEVTSTMDCVAQANTTAQTLEIKATGKASTRIAWFDGQELYDVGLMAAA